MAFCYAMMAKEASGLILKGKYIRQYGECIGKSIVIKNDCYEARLMRFIVEAGVIRSLSFAYPVFIIPVRLPGSIHACVGKEYCLPQDIFIEKWYMVC
ncbi:hypothetical protein [uncultured Chitinophaga sp.]|jgi:hypothetical protein|uniref:hypothetical protein n=1 Tax=uncultured Chitinophaga sp. TaxID=339340 RepID=UPI002603C96E|nr:hypothetical protein [uncultured Chitinophaga sp.]